MKTAITITAILLMFTAAFCVNHMDLMLRITEGQYYDCFGQGLAALDFNGDGIDDLAVLQNGWQPDSLANNLRYGRILFYYGGTAFDSIPDFTINGTYNFQINQVGDSGHLVNLGDVNGDGCDDLGVMGYTNGTFITMRSTVSVYYGSQNPSQSPGYYKEFTSNYDGTYAEIDALRDINGDSYADFCYVFRPNTSYEENGIIGFVLGGTMQEFIWRVVDDDVPYTVSGVGDANHDGFDDYMVVGGNILTGETINTLFFGNATAAVSDSLLLYSQNYPTGNRGKYLGDVNADGIDDFAGVMLGSAGLKIWLGNDNLTNQYDLVFLPGWSGTGDIDHGLVHGDLNNDGFEDVIGSSPLAHGQSGGFVVWLGRAIMNGTSDLEITGYYPGMLGGTGMAAGDFNADGYCDVAASSPHFANYSWDPGFVCIYSGNAQLSDTTISTDDYINQPSVNLWSFRVVPNPREGRQNWKLMFSGSGYDKLRSVTARLYNLKGQKLGTYKIAASELKSGESLLPALDLPAGVYEISLYDRGQLLQARKATIR